ncbi:MAG: ABC transporter substrate-binding protein [Clostridia bacterium]|nr:ABC transporter substrate-binding protein [Clostridia bacterium]
MKFFNKYSITMASVAGILMLFSFFENKQNKFFNIGITQIVEHEALDKARQGFIDELKNLGYEEGKNVRFDFQNAGGDFSNCESIANKFVSQNCDLILAISTPSAQAVANATKNIPILVTGITNPKEAGLVESNDKPNTNITGTSDLSPVKETIKLITKLKPETKKIGVLYSSLDTSPMYQAKLAENEIKNLGLEPIMATVSQMSEVQPITENLILQADVIYVPIDKITSSAMTLISDIALRNNKFVVCSENLINKGAAACYGIDYYELGKLTAKQAAIILEKKNTPQNMPIEYSDNIKLFLNEELLERLNIEITNDLLKIAEVTGE